jgi:hypothetical protein
LIREIELLVDAGVKHIALNFDAVAELRRFVTDVLPDVHFERQ